MTSFPLYNWSPPELAHKKDPLSVPKPLLVQTFA
jgi:hypothetical protein